MDKLLGYKLKTIESKKYLLVLEFISEGCLGEIHKLIRFNESPIKGIYYLEFGNKIVGTEEVDTTSISNNGDSEKVFATVIDAIYTFTEHNPEAWVYATGRTKSRIRLFRMVIAKHHDEVKQDFVILGIRNGEWKDFNINVDFTAFIVKRKVYSQESEKPDPDFLPIIYKRTSMQFSQNSC